LAPTGSRPVPRWFAHHVAVATTRGDPPTERRLRPL